MPGSADHHGPGVDRAAFMAGIRAALDRGETGAGDPPAPPEVDESLVRRVDARTSTAELMARFTAAATDAGMQVRVTPRAALESTLRSILDDHTGRRATISIADDETAATARAAIAAAGGEVVDWRGAPGLELHYDADVGITDVDAAIAETGSIVVSSGPSRSRGSFLVPPVHVAIVFADVIVPDLVDLWPVWQSSAPPAASVIVTGPSKTADIEGILITGVHGPKTVEIVLVHDSA